MAGLRLQRLTRVFPGGVVAVEDLDLDIRDSEFLVLLGPSGCGKTTTLRLIAGLEAPTAGRILLGKTDITERSPRDRDVAMVFQNYALYPHMSVQDNLAFGLRMRKTPRTEIRRRIRHVAEILDICPLLERKPAALSGGQRQRVALGRAIVREPAAFLFDEPLSNLDAKLRVHTRAELIRLHRRLGTTMVYVTHDQTEALTMGRRVAILDAGRLQQVGPPLEVYDRPANLMVAGFIGSPPMNTCTGVIETDHDDATFRGGGLTVPLAGLPAARDAILGVRPEHVGVVPGSAASDRDAPAVGAGTVVAVEPLGSETLIDGRTETGVPIIARTTERPDLRPDAPVSFHIRPENVHLFRPDTGTRLEDL